MHWQEPWGTTWPCDALPEVHSSSPGNDVADITNKMNVTGLRSCLMTVSWRGSSSPTPRLAHVLMSAHRNILIQTMCQGYEYPPP